MEGSRRARRRRLVRELQAAGRYGPRLRDVLPALAGCVVLVCAVVAALAAAYRLLGVGAPLLGVMLLVVAGAAVRRHRRPLGRRRRGFYTPEELAELDTPGLMVAVARMLRRDGWYVLPLPERDRPLLTARDARGRLLDVAFRPVAEPLPDEEAPSSPVATGAGRRLRLVVHRGSFTRRDVQWARRQGHVHLIDAPRLLRWGDGTPLQQLSGPPNRPPSS
jgi:hypothetical protein